MEKAPEPVVLSKEIEEVNNKIKVSNIIPNKVNNSNEHNCSTFKSGHEIRSEVLLLADSHSRWIDKYLSNIFPNS